MLGQLARQMDHFIYFVLDLSHRFRIESVHDEDELDCSLSAHHSDSQTLQDNASIGNLSALSHLANDLISGSQSNVAWLSEPGMS